MGTLLRLAQASALFAGGYGLCLFVLPRLGPIRALREAQPWIGSGDVTQIGFLLFSLAAMALLGRGRLGPWGFRMASPRHLAGAILTALWVSTLFLFAGMAAAALLSGPGQGPGPDAGGPAPFRGLLGTIVSVWIIASSCEEIFYRGLLQGFLAPLKERGLTLFKLRISVPVLFGAVTFGLGHLCLLGMLPGPLVAEIIVSCIACGVIAGRAVEKTGSLLPAIAVHMTFNITGRCIPMILTCLAPG